MDLFGKTWEDHPGQIARHWSALVEPDDIVLVAGDISWAMTLEEAAKDFEWIKALPGQKVFIRGNHDYWWPSLKKLHDFLPPSCHAIHNTAITLNGISVAGTRLWDSPDFSVSALWGNPPKELTEEDKKIYHRELLRLETSLKMLDQGAAARIVMTHYPPIGLDLAANPVSDLLERYGVSVAVFGHLHFPKKESYSLFGEARGVRYYLTACDYLDFKPLRIL